jgi:hypothetical protein
MQERISNTIKISILSAAMLILPGVALAQSTPTPEKDPPSTSDSSGKRGDSADSKTKKKNETAKRGEADTAPGGTTSAEPPPAK